MNVLNDLFLRYLAKNDSRMLIDYCVEVGRVKEIESALLACRHYDSRTHQGSDLVLYSKIVVRGRWEEAEAKIVGNSDCAIEYSRDVLRGRFPLFENRLIDDKNKSVMVTYCCEIKQRVLDLEPHIMKAPFHRVLDYIVSVIGGRFELAEPKIIKNPGWILRYINALEECGKLGEFPVEMHSAMVLYSASKPKDRNVKEYFATYAK